MGLTKAEKDTRIARQNVETLLAKYRADKTKSACEVSFREFVKQAWSVVEPGKAYVHGWHIEAIAEHLQAVADGEILNLIINMPPRHMKSTLVSIMFPAWVWLTRPSKQFLYASYAESLSIRHSVACRRLIKSPWYQQQWADRFSIVSHQDEKRKFDNDKNGYRLSTSVGGANTGEGADIILYDDPNNVNDVNSSAMREAANEWHDQTMSTRLNNPKTGARIVVQQRCHEEDITGHLLEKGGWELLILPAEYEGVKKVTSIGWEDPRTQHGEFLWEAQFGKAEIDKLKTTMGEVGAAGQLQQRPSPGEGAMFKRESFNYWNPATRSADPKTGRYKPVEVRNLGAKEKIYKNPVSLPIAFEQVLASWDLAFKGESDSDFVCGQIWGRIGANFYLIDQIHGRMDFPATVKAVKQASYDYPCPEKLIEDKANGPAVIATLKNHIPGIIPITPDGGKIARANAVAPYVEAGNVFLPNPEAYPWVESFIEEHANFPRGRRDDMVDSASQALRRLADSISNSGVPEFRVMPRVGEPETACHIEDDAKLRAACPSHWRRWIAVSPSQIGAAVWVAETPSGALRVYREMDLEGMDATEVGRRIAEASIPDVQAFLRGVHSTAKWQIDVLLEKPAFIPIEPIGCYAELLEQGILGYDPTSGTYEERTQIKQDLKQAKFSAQIGAVEDAAFDRLRDLLRFKPADYEEMAYDRTKAFKLADMDIKAYTKYMNMVQGIIPGDYPRLKIAASCKQMIAAMGSNRRDAEITDPFMRALMIALTAPPQPMGIKKPFESPGRPNKPGSFGRVFRRAM